MEIKKDDNTTNYIHLDNMITEENELYYAFKYILENTQRKITKDQIEKALKTALKEVG